jgi:hypothetical protein
VARSNRWGRSVARPRAPSSPRAWPTPARVTTIWPD